MAAFRDPEKSGWERSDFPILCETCLGDNPYVRMSKSQYGMECKICTRPFTVFRWRPGRDARVKKTEICQTCSKMKNVCQTCLLDLEYGLPVAIRDEAYGTGGGGGDAIIPKTDKAIQYQAEVLDARAANGEDFESSFGKTRANDTILKLQRTTPYYKRNLPHICSFFVKGECTRGSECPYRHETQEENELSKQNLKDRYYGVNDPVANKMLRRAGEMPSLEPPEEQSITTLFVGGITPIVTEQDLKEHFASYGELKSIKIIPARSCAFVAFVNRQSAEHAAEANANKLVIKGFRLKLLWGRPPAPKEGASTAGADGGGGAGGGRGEESAGTSGGRVVQGGGGGGGNGGGEQVAQGNAGQYYMPPPPQQHYQHHQQAPPVGMQPYPLQVPGYYQPFPPPHSSMYPVPPPNYFNLPYPQPPPQAPYPPIAGPGPSGRAAYPSMDPTALGTRHPSNDD